VLGSHRPDDDRTGWLDGASAAHPTRGGLRIGKHLPERGAGERLDERLEWDRDGQYFHYLTKWMHALDQVSASTGDPRFRVWARELAGWPTSHPGGSGGRGMPEDEHDCRARSFPRWDSTIR
jgi:hypothetical protein